MEQSHEISHAILAKRESFHYTLFRVSGKTEETQGNPLPLPRVKGTVLVKECLSIGQT